MQGNPEEEEEEEEESHPTTSLRPSVFPFAYIRAFYNEMDEASMRTNELKAFAYDQSIKQIDTFYGRAANYCKFLQKALQKCQNSLAASKLYDAFERDHQMLANNLNREWIIAVNDKMRVLGITVPEEDTQKDGLEENTDEVTHLELAAELLERSTETQSISTESNTTIMVSMLGPIRWFINTHSRNEGERKRQSGFVVVVKYRGTKLSSSDG